MSAIAGRLPPEQAGAIVLAAFLTALTTVTLDVALAVVLARSVRRGWRERHRGAASAVRAAQGRFFRVLEQALRRYLAPGLT
jgi:multidrug efflux pump subunit AcrB